MFLQKQVELMLISLIAEVINQVRAQLIYSQMSTQQLPDIFLYLRVVLNRLLQKNK